MVKTITLDCETVNLYDTVWDLITSSTRNGITLDEICVCDDIISYEDESGEACANGDTWDYEEIMKTNVSSKLQSDDIDELEDIDFMIKKIRWNALNIYPYTKMIEHEGVLYYKLLSFQDEPLVYIKEDAAPAFARYERCMLYTCDDEHRFSLEGMFPTKEEALAGKRNEMKEQE